VGKEAYYFSHDANARQDEKILMLRAEHGWEGYGIYWALIEMMFESGDSCLSHSKVKGIAVSYNIDITLLKNVINTCIIEELFNTNEEKFWSESLIKRKSKYHEIKQKKSEAGKKGMEKRWRNKDSNNDVITDDNSVITKDNKGKESKGNKSKVNESKVKKNKYADYVSMTQPEYEKLIEQFGETGANERIVNLNLYKGSKGVSYKNDYLTILSWERKNKTQQKKSIFDQGEESKKRQEAITPLSAEELERMKKWEEELPF
jgi:hypothetical protein